MAVREGVGGAEVGRVHDAIARGEWSGAVAALRAEADHRTLTPDELQLLGEAAYAAGAFEDALTAWEQLHARHVAARDQVAAAGTATTLAMYLLMDTGLMAPVRGWSARAERLLEDHAETPVHAWLAMVRTYERLLSGDLEAARGWAARAIEVGTRQDVAAPVALGRVATARLTILDGHLDDGLELLDEVAVSLLSGELEPLATGMVYCELICAMQGLAQYDRAEQWTVAMERWRTGNAFGGINGRCRVHRAEILRLRGSCEAAEEAALLACDELRPWMRREFGWPLTELGTIRLRRGDLAGAEDAFLAAHEQGWEPQPGLALLRLAQGEVAQAVALIGGALDHPRNVPSKERPPQTALCRAPLLDAHTEIAVAAGDPSAARRAAEELTDIAARFHSQALLASAALARARVALATDDPHAALTDGQAAVGAWSGIGAPYETAAARRVVAAAHHRRGDRDHALLELRAARNSFERIGAHDAAREAAAAEATVLAGDMGMGLEGGPATADAEHGNEGGQSRATGSSTEVFRLEGDTRTVSYDGVTVLLRDLKGLRYLERLLSEPGREFHVLDLVAAQHGSTVADTDVGPLLDDQAKEAYRRRLREVEEDIDEATRLGDADRVALAEADRDYLVGELSRAFGLGGRARRAGAGSERARASVTRALRYALDRIGQHHVALAEHLERTVHTGTYCSYSPDPRLPIRWDT
jgi:hypothetical protein